MGLNRSGTKSRSTDLQQLYFLYDPDATIKKAVAEPRREIIIPDFIIPESINYNYKANFAEQTVLGRLSPVFMYEGGSPRTIAFNILLNEDIATMTGEYESLVELVDRIKSLSYPSTKEPREKQLPQVYFQLGELSGKGIVETSVTWKKPFNISTGQYKYAEVSFNITIETAFSSPQFVEGLQKVEGTLTEGDFVFDEALLVSYNHDDVTKITSALNGYYDLSISSLISFDGVLSEDIQQALAKSSFNTFQHGVTRLNNIYSKVADIRGIDAAELAKLQESADIFNILTANIQSLVGEDDAMALLTAAIEDAKRRFRAFLDYYYEDVMEDKPYEERMTEEEKYKVLDDVLTLLESLQTAAEGVIKYGAGN